MALTEADRALLAIHALGGAGDYAGVCFVLGRLDTPPDDAALREALYIALGAWVGAVAEPLSDTAEERAARLLHGLLARAVVTHDAPRDLFVAVAPAPVAPPAVRAAVARLCALWHMTRWQPPSRWQDETDLAPNINACTALCTAGAFDIAADVLMTAVDDHSPTVHDQLDLWGAYRTQLRLWQYIVGDSDGAQIVDPPTRMLALMNAGRAHDNLGDYASARAAYAVALGLAQALHDSRTEGQLLGNLGLVCHSLGDYPQAIAYYEEAVSRARAVGNRTSEGRQLGNLGQTYWRMGEQHTALAFQQQRLTIARELDDKRGEGTALSNIGLVMQSLGHSDRALALFRQALAIRRAIGDRTGEAADLTHIGAALDAAGQDAPQALGCLLLAALIRAAIGSPNRAATFAHLHRMQETWPDSPGWFHLALQRWCATPPANPHDRAIWQRALADPAHSTPAALAAWLHAAITAS